MDVAVYAQFYNPTEAQIVLQKLQFHGIQCFLTNENASQLLWHLSVAHGGVSLMLKKSDFERANQILQEEALEIENIEDAKEVCPKCHSNNIKFGAPSQRKTHWMQLIISLFFVAPVPGKKSAYHCFNCGHNFEKSEVVLLRSSG